MSKSSSIKSFFTSPRKRSDESESREHVPLDNLEAPPHKKQKIDESLSIPTKTQSKGNHKSQWLSFKQKYPFYAKNFEILESGALRFIIY